MFATYDMNPIAIQKMQQDRLNADIEYVDRSAPRQIPAVVIVALVAVTVILL